VRHIFLFEKCTAQKYYRQKVTVAFPTQFRRNIIVKFYDLRAQYLL